MIRSLFLLLKITLIILVAGVVTFYSGDVIIHWASYKIETSTTVLVAFIAAVACIVYFLSHLIWYLRRFPVSISRLFRVRSLDNMEYTMKLVLDSLKAEDSKLLKKDLGRLADIVNDTVLKSYFEGKIEKLKQSEESLKIFQDLSTLRDGKFLGNRELADQALSEKDYAKALFHTECALSANKKSPWALKTALALYLREESYDQAYRIVTLIEHSKVWPRHEIYKLQASIFYKKALLERDIKTQNSLLEKAVELDSTLLPAVLSLAKVLTESKKITLSQKIIERVWLHSPHPDLVNFYLAGAEDDLEKAKFMERLCKLNPNTVVTLEGSAEIYLKAKLWGKARENLKRIPDSKLTIKACKIWADLEISEYEDMKKAQNWYEKMLTALPVPKWSCTECSESSSKWHPVCKNCLSLNSIQWR